jgi:hypothetical protein
VLDSAKKYTKKEIGCLYSMTQNVKKAWNEGRKLERGDTKEEVKKEERHEEGVSSEFYRACCASDEDN